MANQANARSKTGAAARSKALGKLARPADVPTADELLELFDQIDCEFRWGAVWTRPGMDEATRAMVALAMVTSKCQNSALDVHLRLCVNAGVSKTQVAEVLLHVYCYAGAYAALGGFQAAKRVFDELELAGTLSPRRRANRTRRATNPTVAARIAAGLRVRKKLLSADYVNADHAIPDAFMNMFDDLTYEFCFGNIWTRPALKWRTRSQLTLGIAAATHQVGAIDRHVRIALRNGLSREDIGEVFLLAYPYSGAYPCYACFDAARKTFADIAQEQKNGHPRLNAPRRGRARVALT